MILPVGASSFKEAMKMGVEVYHHLKVTQSFLSDFIFHKMKKKMDERKNIILVVMN